MRKTPIVFCLLLLTAAIEPKAHSQDTAKAPEAPKAEPAVHYYHLDISIQELGSDGKPTNSRSYSTTVSTDQRSRGASIRTGSRIPIVTGAASANGESKQGVQFQYVDVGVNIDVRSTREVGHELALDLSAEVSSLADSSTPVNQPDPVIRQNYWQAVALIPIDKATVVFASERLESKGSMQLAITATAEQ
jgi:hypothetical protein